MSAVQLTAKTWIRPSQRVGQMSQLHLVEKLCLAVGIIEIPLQIDKYLMYHESDALQGAVGGFNISITTCALFVLYALWFLQSSLRPRVAHLPMIMGVPMLLYLLTVGFSALSATLPILSAFDCWLLVQAYLLFFYIANRIETKHDVVICLMSLATTLLIQALLIFGLKALRVDNTEIQIGPLMLTVWEGERHGGSMQSPVLAGSTMALIWLPIATLLIAAQHWHSKWSARVWWVALLATVAGMLAILLTQTRGAIVTSAVGCTIMGTGLLLRGWLPKWIILVSVLMALLSIGPLWIIYEKRIQHGDGDSAIARKHLSLIAMEMISDQPLLGFGAGNCHLAAQRYADQAKYRSEWYYTIHSKYLLVWVETGLVGLLAFLGVIATGIRSSYQAWRSRDVFLSPIGLALGAALTGHAVHMSVDIFNSRSQVQMLWVILGLLAAVAKVAVYESSRARPWVGYRSSGGAA